MQRTLTALLLSLALVAALVAHPCGAEVTDQQIEDAEVVLEGATRGLNGLLCQRTLERVQPPADSLQAILDSTMAAHDVRVRIDTTYILTETQYVRVIVPTGTWPPLERREWRVHLRESNVKYIQAAPGRYRVRRDRLPAFRRVVCAYLDPPEEI